MALAESDCEGGFADRARADDGNFALFGQGRHFGGYRGVWAKGLIRSIGRLFARAKGRPLNVPDTARV